MRARWNGRAPAARDGRGTPPAPVAATETIAVTAMVATAAASATPAPVASPGAPASARWGKGGTMLARCARVGLDTGKVLAFHAPMKADERTISKILTEQIRYEIPPYQRPYSWERENVQQFLDDVWEAYKADDTEYFIGSLITIEKERDRRYDVVDGQQRLTTLNLIFARLREAISNPAAKAQLGQRILPRDALTGETETPRLLLRKKDQSFFLKHVLEAKALPEDRDELEEPQKHLAENVEEIDAFCADKDDKTLRLFTRYLLDKVYVVFVTTDSWKSAYRLFNVLNARGMKLSNADLIKNSLFSQLGAQQAKRSDELEERWIELEQQVGIEELDTFFSHHRSALVGSKARGSLHEEIEPLIKATQGGLFAFLDAVLGSAKKYARIVDGEFTDISTLRSLRALQRVGYDEWIPALLAYLNSPAKGLPEPEFVGLLEKVTMQNWVRRLGRTARLTVYYQLIAAIQAGKRANEIRLIFQKNAQNKEFFELLGGDVYGKPFHLAVLLRLEEAMQDESVTKTYSDHITIEHVLPQTLTDKYWKDRFTEEEHNVWIHRLGNLAPLSGRKNYRAQNYDFDRKKKIYSDANKSVSFDLTKEIVDQPEWTVPKIKARQRRLMTMAKEIWTIA